MTMNDCFFEGNLTRDMELRHTARGLAVGEFTLCVDTNRKNEKREWESIPNYLRFRLLGARADALAGKLVKGARAVVRATARWEDWTEADTGKHREAVRFIVNDIVVVSAPMTYAAHPIGEEPHDAEHGWTVISGDDIPF